MDGSVFLPPEAPAEITKLDLIRDTAIKCFAEQGIAATGLRTIAAEAHCSPGLIQHYFGSKSGLIAAVDKHVLTVFSEALERQPLTADPSIGLAEASGRFAALMSKNPAVMDYVGRALTEGGKVGTVIFDGLFKISQAQGAAFAAQGLVMDDIDPVWGHMAPLILRIGSIILRPHIERHLDAPLYQPDETQRWDAAVTSLIRKGQFTSVADRADAQ
ncbi:helix-turn-helix domain-containing protein [Mycolicibacterium sp. Y3]